MPSAFAALGSGSSVFIGAHDIVNLGHQNSSLAVPDRAGCAVPRHLDKPSRLLFQRGATYLEPLSRKITARATTFATTTALARLKNEPVVINNPNGENVFTKYCPYGNENFPSENGVHPDPEVHSGNGVKSPLNGFKQSYPKINPESLELNKSKQPALKPAVKELMVFRTRLEELKNLVVSYKLPDNQQKFDLDQTIFSNFTGILKDLNKLESEVGEKLEITMIAKELQIKKLDNLIDGSPNWEKARNVKLDKELQIKKLSDLIVHCSDLTRKIGSTVQNLSRSLS